MDKQRYILAHDQARQRATHAVLSAPGGYVVEVKEPTRSLDQNALLWPLLTDLSNQLEWFGQKMSPDDWKDLLTAAFRKGRAVPGIDGGVVFLGLRTSRMGKREFSDFLESIYAFGAERGVRWSC